MYKGLAVALAFVFIAAVGCKDKGKDGGGSEGAGGDTIAAETPLEKDWLAWKEDACKCKDLACASATADARLKLEKKHPDSLSPKQKNVANIIKAANACLQKATGQ